MRNIACVYHSADLDGWMSAAIVRHYMNKTFGRDYIESYVENGNTCYLYKGPFDDIALDYPSITFFGWNYGNKVPDLSEYDYVIMSDISFPYTDMLALTNRLGDNFVWCDHHISAINDSEKHGYNPAGIRDSTVSACELTWSHFFTEDYTPEIVYLLGMYDSFRHKGTAVENYVLEFQYGARAVISDYQQAFDYLIESIGDTEVVGRIHRNGQSIFKYLCKESEQIYKSKFAVMLSPTTDGFKQDDNSVLFACVNRDRFNPVSFGIDYHKEGYDGFICFYFNGKGWAFSIYNDNGKIDCSVIARKFGGGGHKGASGFMLDMTNFHYFMDKCRFSLSYEQKRV